MAHAYHRNSAVLALAALVLTLGMFGPLSLASALQQRPEGAASSTNQPLTSVTLDLPAGEAVWQVTELQTGAEDDPAMTFEPGFVYALDDPLLLLFDDGTPLERLQTDSVFAVGTAIEAHPVPMMAEAPVPFVTIGVGSRTDADDPNAAPFAIDAGEYELSLWLIDTSTQVPAEIGQRLAAQVHPLMLLVRSGEVTLPSTEAGEEPRHLVPGDWAVITPQDRLQAAPDAEPPVLLFATLEQPGQAAAPTGGPAIGSGSSAPPRVTSTGPLGGLTVPEGGESTEPMVEATVAPTEEPLIEPTVTVPIEQPDPESPAESGSGDPEEFDPLPIDPGPVTLPTEESDGSFEPLPIETGPITLPTEASSESNDAFESRAVDDLSIFTTDTANSDSNPSGSARVEQTGLSCFAHIADADADGLSDACEEEYGSNPNKPDTDGDGLTDVDEVRSYKSNPTLFDTDGDKLTDGDEINVHGTSPIATDTDGDSLSDANEVNTYRTDPRNPDTDGDGLNDGFDLGSGTDPLNADFDGDGLLDGAEMSIYGTEVKSYDTDGDGLSDGEEILTYGTDPFVADMDGDCLGDNEIKLWGTSPFTSDTDGDGALDPWDEAPLDPNDDSEFTFGTCD